MPLISYSPSVSLPVKHHIASCASQRGPQLPWSELAQSCLTVPTEVNSSFLITTMLKREENRNQYLETPELGKFQNPKTGSLVLKGDVPRNQDPTVPWDTSGLEEIYSVWDRWALQGTPQWAHHSESCIYCASSPIIMLGSASLRGTRCSDAQNSCHFTDGETEAHTTQRW